MSEPQAGYAVPSKHEQADNLLAVAAVLGFAAVALGAIGAHAFEATLKANSRLATYQTAVFYHCFHTLGLLATGLWLKLSTQHKLLRWAGWLFTVGTLCFSGSLYLLCFFEWRPLVFITPMGGFLFLGGWLCLLIAAVRK
jgi:uncharacterized membrane protein YgdD (TMEM256/DUF423 family)